MGKLTNYFYMIIFNGYVSEYQNVSSPKSHLKATQKIRDEIMSFIERNISGVAKYLRILAALGLSIHLQKDLRTPVKDAIGLSVADRWCQAPVGLRATGKTIATQRSRERCAATDRSDSVVLFKEFSGMKHDLS